MRSEENWRLRVDAPWTLACVAILLATLGVHYTALSEDRTDLALPELIHTMETKCHALGDTFDAAAAASAPPSHPVPTQFGVAVWVEQQAWALPVHDALDRIEAAVGRAVVADATNRRYIQRIVRVTTNASWRRVRISSGDHAAFALVAAKQQLGLGVAKHVYAVDLREELRMHGISFFRDTSSASSAEAAGLRCFLFETRQAYCTVNANASAEWLQREVPAAVATLMAGWLGVDNFRDAVTLRRWAVARDVSGCHYALRALRQLQQSVSTHPDMPAPEDVSGTVQRLLSLIRAGKFSQLARAADDLQYHPLLLPQLYIPWDHALVVHTSILLPVFGMGIISVRLSIAARREQRRRTQQLADGARKAQ